MPRKELVSFMLAAFGFIAVYVATKLGKGALQIILFIVAIFLVLLSMALIFVYDAKKDGVAQALLNLLVGWLLWP